VQGGAAGKGTAPRNGEGGDGMGATVLLVEDDPLMREALRGALAPEGYQLVEATSSAEAIEAMIRKKPDVVLHELGMSEVDGFALLDRLRILAGPNATPILAFTGLGAVGERLLSSGTTDWLLEAAHPERFSLLARSYVASRLARQRERSKRSTWPEVMGKSEAAVAPPQTTPPESTRDRTWDALSGMLGRLTELLASSHKVEEILEEVLIRLLDASGFSLGAAYLTDLDGSLLLRACIGFSVTLADRLSDARGRTSFWHELLSKGEPLALGRSEAPALARDLLAGHAAESLVFVPLVLGKERIGTLMLASVDQVVDPSWIRFAKMIAGPIAQTIALARTVARLTGSEHRFRGIAESTADGIILTNSAGIITFANEAAETITGAPAHQILGQPLKRILPFLQQNTSQGELMREDGTRKQVEATVRSFEDPPGQLNWVYVVRDLSERFELQRVASLASRDPLTGLFNRRRLEEELSSQLASSRRYGTTGALLVLDLDHFKPVNDTFGHQAGDLVLKAVGDVLRSSTRETDVPARFGGDEFVVLLPHADAGGAQVCAGKLLERIGGLSTEFRNDRIRVGVSIGVALFPDHGSTPEELFAAADQALYRAKEAGRNRISQPPPARAQGAGRAWFV
jgi:diguanylate cyclase (GGDEF)-like protein/PAS domain S-box-containing protein